MRALCPGLLPANLGSSTGRAATAPPSPGRRAAARPASRLPDPKRSRTSSSAASSADSRAASISGAGARTGDRRSSNGSTSWTPASSSRPPTATPTSVIPRSAISGAAAPSSDRAASSTASVRAVARLSVCERVAREKSPKRSRNTTVRPTRWAARIRRITRSTSPASIASTSGSERGVRPSARCAPIDRRRRATSTGRGSCPTASAWRWRPAAGPRRDTRAGSPSAATSATVRTPRLRSFAAVTSPTPHSSSTDSGCRNASSPPSGTTRRPSGLATRLATLARNFVRATPTVIGSPTRVATSLRSRRPMSTGGPAILRRPLTSRKASSMEIPSTSGVVSRKTSKTARLAAV